MTKLRSHVAKLHWAVLLLGQSLERQNPVYHEYRRPGETWCGRHWYIAMRIEGDSVRARWVHRKNAMKFATPCRACRSAMEKQIAA
jgi:hypothetical protein